MTSCPKRTSWPRPRPSPPDLTAIAAANHLALAARAGSPGRTPRTGTSESRWSMGPTPFVTPGLHYAGTPTRRWGKDRGRQPIPLLEARRLCRADPRWNDPGVRDNVVHAWKLDKARELARQEAKDLVAKVRESGKSLKDFVADQPALTVLTPKPFTWMVDKNPLGTYTGILSQPDFGEVQGPNGKPIPYLHNPFMERVFALPQGGTDWAENDPQTVVYVVHVAQYRPMESTLWEVFTSHRPEGLCRGGILFARSLGGRGLEEGVRRRGRPPMASPGCRRAASSRSNRWATTRAEGRWLMVGWVKSASTHQNLADACGGARGLTHPTDCHLRPTASSPRLEDHAR